MKMEIKLLEIIEDLADKYSDGHFTLMKFTTNYRFSLGTIDGREEIQEMGVGKTIDEAICDFFKKSNKKSSKNLT
jgi:hypothetical protein